MSGPETPSQTVGPYLSIGLSWDEGPLVVPDDAPGAVWLRGEIRDGGGEVVQDALVETWQAGPDGEFHAPGFRGFGRCPTDDDGRYAIRTVKPGAVAGHAPRIDVTVFARGLLHRVMTRVYFADEPSANAADPVLAAVPAERRATLVAERTEDGYRFDITLQGPDETVFFAV
ncbi:protocatechuate 3,4-dioxygenase subunit alpha [Amorphoplanes digitatis]|uniref:Protocatechuate 3,4-dioxygenase alpha subunit n=1 Tax=Actinoplanes digitatis TaxID=1868 RepID=A0A7W7HXV8_9ACTN|nr:protocatechuate 3,4-dioxygenase subunit alpha [Actinoplanes digitatis]MBB4762766.1 protocatechuate 3,4-dioxygenase alpha subunit [Actinoplanes digitatis]BFE71684.1 protocatechuate 3,4-dioxygenase subunit alpha [Actinoplanes digitatis]GID91738.1 protocatechuate 3,4-dioxygenase subunit alpha [Actinoplanes digitatis]